MEITKEQWKEYLACQERGCYNMLDYNSWSRSGLTTLSLEVWLAIIRNYNELLKKYGE